MEQDLKIQVEELFAEADLVKWFTMLRKAVKDVKDKNPMFREPLENLDSKLEELNPLIENIENKYLTKKKKKEKGVPKLKDVLNQRKWEVGKMVKQIENGNELVRKCSKLSPSNVSHAFQLGHLKKCLNRLLGILTEEGIRNAFGKMVVSRENLGSVTELPDVTVGLDEPLRDLKNKLLNDDVSMLVLNGFGGCGKTTLAIKFCEDEEVKGIFEKNIFFVTVSKEPNLDVIQELRQRMKAWEARPDPLLVVLDDVWSNSESLLKEFYDLNLNNCKILVTSRIQFQGFGTQYNLKALNDEDSMALLRHSASLGDSLYVPEDLLREVLNHCKGVPLAISVTGKSLRGKDTEFWRSRLADWFKGHIPDFEAELLLSLQSSIDALGDNEAIIRECFMDLASFPEGKKISAAAFIDMWAELYNLDEDSQSIMILQELASRGLANLVITRNIEILDDYYIEHSVSQHDRLKDLAIYNAKLDPIEYRKRLIVISGDKSQPINASRLCISSGGLISLFRKCKYVQKSQPINARLLSISSDGKSSTQWKSVHLPQLEVLVLNFKTENNAVPEFVQKIDRLKALIVTNYGSLPTELSNFHLLKSLSNLKRIRLERISIHSITKNFVPLTSIKKISLYMCNIGQAFCNCSIKISDAWPGLKEMNIDYCDDLRGLPAELCDLVHMEILSITNCHKLSALPEEIGKLENLEVLRLRSCTDLERLPISIERLTKLYHLEMYKCFKIKELPGGIAEMSSLRRINVGQCSGLDELPESVRVLNAQLEKVICDEEKKHLWERYIAEDKIKVVREQPNLNWLEMPPL